MSCPYPHTDKEREEKGMSGTFVYTQKGIFWATDNVFPPFMSTFWTYLEILSKLHCWKANSLLVLLDRQG